jgi:hypothetical protein
VNVSAADGNALRARSRSSTVPAFLQGTGGAAISSATHAQIVLTRDSTTNLTSVYLNGALAFSFTDNVGLAVLGDSSVSGNSFLTLFG